LLDVSRITALGWQPKVNLQEGLRLTYDDFLRHRRAEVVADQRI
jgi:nucleoside-diphosphate-sugar epimerase